MQQLTSLGVTSCSSSSWLLPYKEGLTLLGGLTFMEGLTLLGSHFQGVSHFHGGLSFMKGQGSTIALARWLDACFEGVGPVRATSFYILLARQATGFNNGIIHHCFINSFHQLSLLTQQLNIICDNVDSRYQSKLVTILFTNCKFSITSHGGATGDVRRRHEADTSLVN